MAAELPAVAQARMAALRSSGTWGSALTTGEFAAIRGVGFEPVGQVFGAAVFDANAARYACPGAPVRPGEPGAPGGDTPSAAGTVGGRGASGGVKAGPAAAAIEVSGHAGAASFGPLVQAMGQARHTAVDRMVIECALLGGHGVVGVHVSRGAFPAGGAQFAVIGTAVRLPGADLGQATPFTSDLSGQDFAKLIHAGWVPVGLALGISIAARHDDRATTSQARWYQGNAEIAGWTELVNQARHDARRQLEIDVGRLGAEGVVIASMPMHVRQRDCPAAVGRRDHIAEASLIGTAVARFAAAGQPADGPPLAIMTLNPHRRPTAGIRI